MISKIVTLGDVCNKGSSNIAQKDLVDRDGIYPIYGAAGYIKNVDFAHQDKPYLAVVKDGAGIGRVMKLPANSSIIGTMQYILPKGNIDIDYLYFALQYMNLSKYFSGSTIPHIYFRDYQKEKLPLPELSEQQGKAYVLLRIEQLIECYRQQLTKLDELVKSRFIELFGTVKDNPYHFPTATLKEVCHKITDGKHGGCEQEADSGYYYVGAREIYDGAIHYETAPQITYADFAKDYRRCNIEQGDMVIVNTGATIGKSAIASSPLTEQTLLQKSVALLKVKTDVISAEFLRYCYMANPSMYMVESASAQPNLLLSKMNATVIYLPPLDLQEQFAAFVEQTDKSKLAVQKTLEKLETLKKSLMQQYFG